MKKIDSTSTKKITNLKSLLDIIEIDRKISENNTKKYLKYLTKSTVLSKKCKFIREKN